MVAGLLATPWEMLLVAVVAMAVGLAGLGVAVFRVEAGNRRGGREAEDARSAWGAATGAQAPQRRAQHEHLSARELTRLSAFRARARLMAGEPLEAPGWWRKLRFAWREGYSGWVIASVAGAFSMATHFGAYWLITGGGWGGAIAITLLCTTLMVGACAWIGLGLITSR